jgi:tRNA U55 pseudouridine synthase TruB
MSDTRDLGYWEKYEEYEVHKNGIMLTNALVTAPTLPAIHDKLSLLVPTYPLPLPAFSAKKKEGKRFYQLARK